MAGNKRGNGDGGKSDGDKDIVVRQATASNGKGGRQLTATRAMAMVTGTTWVKAMVTRLVGDKECKGEGGGCW